MAENISSEELERDRLIENSIRLCCEFCQVDCNCENKKQCKCDNKLYDPEYNEWICCCFKLKLRDNHRRTYKEDKSMCCRICRKISIRKSYFFPDDEPDAINCLYCNSSIEIQFLRYININSLSAVHTVAHNLNFRSCIIEL